MLRPTTNTCCFFAVFVGLSALSSLMVAQSAFDSGNQPLTEVVLLDNGRVLQGQVTRTVDHVHVRTSSGSRIVLPAKQVDRILDSLSDAWQHRESKLGAKDIEGHLSLFHWCLRYRLKDRAQQQLDRLKQTEIGDRRLKSLDRQLARTFEPPKVMLAEKNRQNKSSNDAPGESLRYLDVDQVFQPLPTVENKKEPMPKVIFDQAVALASHTEPVTTEPKEAAVKTPKKLTPIKNTIQSQLDSMTRQLAREDLHQFQRRVQPILLKGCLAAKCHNSTAAVMPLLHRGRGQLVPKRFTQRNLQSIVDWIDLSDIDRSTLLTQAVAAHGGQKNPAMQVGSKEFKLLSDWLRQVVENSPEVIPQEAAPNKIITIGQVGLESSQNQALEADKPLPDNRTSPKRLKPLRELPKPVVDPFDPATFNRMSSTPK